VAVTENNSSKFKKRALALAVASCLSLSSMAVQAAGLGKLTVFSSLGQPLRAEMELSATPEELSGMTARLAPQDLFKQTGVEFSPALTDLRFVVEKRPNGKPVIKLSSARPVNEPFLDFLVELNWPAGRLVREYTFLLDPSEFSKSQGAQSSVDAKIVETVRGGGVNGSRAQPPLSERPVAAPREAVAAKTPAKATPDTRMVERGDTLRKIAAETQYSGVSLEQMLVGLYRNNRDAFIGNDIHRLKAGVILNIPDQASVAAVSHRDARNVYIASGDFSAYRRKLAGVATAAAPREAGPAEQSVGGRITPRIEEKTPAIDPSKDQVKVSRADVSAKDAAISEIDRLARDKALQEAQSRLALLEKNVAELQKLLEMKNQRLAELENPAVPAGVPELAAAPAEKPPVPTASDVLPDEAKKVEDAVPPAQEPAPAPVPQPVVKAPPPPAPPVVVEEPGLLDTVLADPLPLAGGAAAVALLAGLLVLRRRKQGDGLPKAPVASYSSATTQDSGFRTTGGQSVDTGSVPLHTGEFSQAGPGTIDTDDVDPVAEADVYMAYGRDAQAEEILLEAMQKDPSRLAIHAKLLEIYANRRSLKQFETLAAELYAQTAGIGPEWDKVAALGAGIDPANPLYGAKDVAAVTPSANDFDPGATLVVRPSQMLAATATAAAAAEAFSAVQSASDTDKEPLSFTTETKAPVEKFDLQENNDSAPLLDVLPDVLPDVPALGDDNGMVLDFDLGGELDSAVAPEAQSPELTQLEGLAASPLVVEPAQAADLTAAESSSDALDFDLSGMVGVASDRDDMASLAVVEPEAVDLTAAEALDLPSFAEPEASEASTALDDIPGLSMPEAEPAIVPSEADNVLDMDFGFDEMPVSSATDDLPEFAASAPASAALPDVEDLSLTSSMEEILASSPAVEDLPEPKKALLSDEDLSLVMPDLPDVSLDSASESLDVMDSDVTPAEIKEQDKALPEPDFDLASINLDLSAEPASALSTAEISLDEALVDTMPALAGAATVDSDEDMFASEAAFAEQNDPRWEEVNTKLDLAKAYEEMGDLEGARELLQEVIGDGPADLVSQAQTILDRMSS
jgi:pilus assembly protein FimV